MVRSFRASLSLLALGASCATGHGGGGPQASTDRAVVTVGPEAVAQGEQGLAAWILYGAARARVFESRLGKLHNQSGDDYALELGGRAAMADYWSSQRARSGKANPYLDLLVELRQAGHLDEYVVTFFAK